MNSTLGSVVPLAMFGHKLVMFSADFGCSWLVLDVLGWFWVFSAGFGGIGHFLVFLAGFGFSRPVFGVLGCF